MRSDRIEPIADRLISASLPRDEPEEIGTDIAIACALAWLLIAVTHASLVIVVMDHARPVGALTVHDESLIVASSGFVGISQSVRHRQERVVLVTDASA